MSGTKNAKLTIKVGNRPYNWEIRDASGDMLLVEKAEIAVSSNPYCQVLRLDIPFTPDVIELDASGFKCDKEAE